MKLTKNLYVKLVIVCISTFFLIGYNCQKNAKEASYHADSFDNKMIVLMADQANKSETLQEKILDTSLKRAWVENWTSPDQFFEWTMSTPEKGNYKVSILIQCNPGAEVDLIGSENILSFKIEKEKWDYFEIPGDLKLPQGESIIRVRLKKPGEAQLRSLHLINRADEEVINQKISEFRSDTKWLSEAQYGLMFQWGGWGYPQQGDKKPWPKMIDDFNVDKFANMVKETGAGYVVWSATWSQYLFPAPIQAIKNISPDRISNRDLIAELADALQKRKIKLILYYHLGHGKRNMDWWEKNWTSQDDKELFFKNFCAITSEIGMRYQNKLDGWMIDDGMIIAPAPFERLGKALKAGYPNRIISYNSWILPRMTDLQDFHFGEGNQWGRYGTGEVGSGLIKEGPQKGLQAHANFILDGPGWGIRQPNTVINPPRFSEQELIKMAENAKKKMTLSFNLLMYENGTVSEKSLDALKIVRQVLKGDRK